MDLQIHHDPRAFRVLADRVYGADTLRHTIALTVMARFFGMAREDTPVMGSLHDNGELVGVAFRTPPWPVLVSGLPTDPSVVESFLTQWLETDPGLPGVSGPVDNVNAVAAAWTRLTGGSACVTLASRLFQLGDLIPPVVPGRAREATEDDLELLVRWRTDFQVEALGFQGGRGDGEAEIRRRFEIGDSLLLWEDGGRPVSSANASAPVGGMSRVGPVYTPPEHRERGYGSAVTAAVSQHARDAGADNVLLFADLMNPVSNSIYQKLGYRPVYDSSELEFTRLPSTT
jgi:GNAT superfamily N-acetyltransferase